MGSGCQEEDKTLAKGSDGEGKAVCYILKTLILLLKRIKSNLKLRRGSEILILLELTFCTTAVVFVCGLTSLKYFYLRILNKLKSVLCSQLILCEINSFLLFRGTVPRLVWLVRRASIKCIEWVLFDKINSPTLLSS